MDTYKNLPAKDVTETLHRLADLLVDARCAYRDGHAKYGADCIEEAERILRDAIPD